MDKRTDAIFEIRQFNRFYTNILGLVDEHILNMGYSLTEARILFELNEMGLCKASKISSKLNVDKSYLSRILKKFEKSGLIYKEISSGDGREQLIKLSPSGKECISALIEKSNSQICKLLSSLDDKKCAEIIEAMDTIKKHLTKAADIIIRPFNNEDIEFVIRRHIEMYSEEYGLTSDIWKNYVSEGVHQFADNFDSDKDCMYIVDYKGEPSGCIAIAHASMQTAQLRFFLIDSSLRGLGLGRRLMDEAISFCRDKKYMQIFLWTFSTLEAARYLYKEYGFNISEVCENSEWGRPILEEKWEMHI
ncbi:MAG: MarR family winged helix-turn-helix transcriptional regulator [Eubacteriaceae bacterium]